ncbi:MAG: methyltransferase domain-containing protein [Bacteroidetes bacterium]|nr:methyltransferase domain-containing protein [Bacteroidota bacterium]
MKINTNGWNRFRYTVYIPIYDVLAYVFKNTRKAAAGSLHIKAGEKVLILGSGTGLDLPNMPDDCEITAIDLTPAMVATTKRRNRRLKKNLSAFVMDGQNLTFPDNTFDKVIIHLVLAVIPDPYACLKEAERVAKPGAVISVFDKLLPKGKRVTWIRKILNYPSDFFFSDINRDIYEIASHTNLKIVQDIPENFWGLFRRVLLEK